MRKASGAVGPKAATSNHLNRVEDVDDEHLGGDAQNAPVGADGHTAETCGHKANILKQ